MSLGAHLFPDLSLKNEEKWHHREIRENEDQRVPPPLQNNVADEAKEGEDLQYEDSNQDINYFGELLSEGFLMEYVYQNFYFFYSNISQEEIDFSL